MHGSFVVGAVASIDFEVDGAALVVSAVIARHEGEVLTVVVRRGPEPRPPRSPRLTPPAGRMVAVFVPEGVGVGRCCQPILDINARAMRIQSNHPFESGTVLKRLSVILQNQVVRRAEGIVTDRSERIDAQGRSSYECAVRLRAPTALALDDDPDEVLEINDPARVRGILWALCDLSQALTLRIGHKLMAGHLDPVKGARDTLPTMRCVMSSDDAPAVAGAIQVECALYGSGYRFYARISGKVGRVLMLQPAPVIREWHRRDEERLLLKPGEARIEFEHPVSGERAVREVEDASVHGVGFRAATADEMLWPGLPLGRVRLHLPGVTVRPPLATVRTLSAHRCGVQLAQLGDRDSDRIRVELAKLAARPIELHDGEELDEILRFHESVRLLEPDMVQNLDAALDDTRRQWRIAHQHPDGLVRTALVRWKGGVGATLTLVRAYDATWVLQHSAVASPAVPANPGMLHSLLVRLAIPRLDGEYVCGYIDEEARSQHSVMSAFFNEWSTPEHRGATRFSLYSAATRPLATVPPPGLRRLTARDDLLVENAAARVLDPICARALGLRRGEITMAATRAAYGRVGLERGREAWGSFRRGRCGAILLRELASPGLCLSSLLSAGVIIPVDQSAVEEVRALVEVMLSQPLPGHPPFRFLLLPDGCDERGLLAAGLRRVAGCTLYAMHRFGLQEYHRYVASRYGFLHGRLRARTTEAA